MGEEGGEYNGGSGGMREIILERSRICKEGCGRFRTSLHETA